MLTYILYESAHRRFADVCAYSLRHHSPTALTKLIDTEALRLQDTKQKFAPLLLAASHNDWFLCCRAELVFLQNPMELLEYAHPNKTVFKITRFGVFDSPILLWNGQHNVCFDADTINYADEQALLDNTWANEIGDLPDDWAGSSDHDNPKAILFGEIPTGRYTDIWNGYYEAFTECSEK